MKTQLTRILCVVAACALLACGPLEPGEEWDETGSVEQALPVDPTPIFPSCVTTCTQTTPCDTTCRAVNGYNISCGTYGKCRSCTMACKTSSTPCETKCLVGTALKTCSTSGSICRSCSYTHCSPSSCSKICRLSSGSYSKCNTWAKSLGDADVDEIPETLEDALAAKFFPKMEMHCGTYLGVPYGSYGQFYGGGHYTKNDKTARVPFVVREFRGSLCPDSRQCLEIVYGLPYNWDLGDNSTIGEHPGDSETYAVLVARKSLPGRPAWGVSWSTAKKSASYWKRVREFAAAHMCEKIPGTNISIEGSKFRSTLDGSTSCGAVYVAEGKNATYFSRSACNNGGVKIPDPLIPFAWEGSDDCSDHRCWIDRTNAVARLLNVGERKCHAGFETVIPVAKLKGSTPTDPPSNTYAVWTGGSFGEATAFVKKLRDDTLDWDSREHVCW